MKKFEHRIFSFLTVFILLLVFISCEKDQDIFTNDKSKQLFSQKSLNDQPLSNQSISYLKEKLPDFELNNIDNSNDTYFFAEVKANNNVGYLVTDIKQENIIVFIKFNLKENITTIYDYIENEEVNSIGLQIYNTFNFAAFANEAKKKPRRFWGWQCRNGVDVGGSCYRFCEYFIFGLSNGGSSYLCNDLPGRNPVIIDDY